jgi:MSHA biogenesis protein MshL
MKLLISSIVMVSLVGCAAPAAKQETLDAIKAELSKAAQTNKAKAASAEVAASSLLPALVPDMPIRKPLEERFNVSISNAPASQFFMGIVEGTPYNMLVHPDVSGMVSANLKNVTLIEALEAIRDLYGYDYKIDGTRIYVKPLTLQTRVFQINYLSSIRKGTSDIRVSSGSVSDLGISSGGSGSAQDGSGGSGNNGSGNGGGQNVQRVNSSKVSTTSTNDFWGELKMSLDVLAGVGKDGRQVVINPQSGVVVIRAMSDELRNVAAYLKATQLSVDRQVILEAKILEVELNDEYQTGINWASFKTGPNSAASLGFVSPGSTLSPRGSSAIDTGINAIAGTSLGAASKAVGSLFGLAFQTSNFSALLSFLESQGNVHVLSSPRIATLNNQKAVLKVGTDEFFVTSLKTTPGTTSTSGNTAPTVSVEVQPFFSGVALDVTPQIDDGGNIVLHVHPSVSKVSSVEKSLNAGSAGTIVLPLASSVVSETDSIVRGQNGRIIAIGGLMRQANVNDRSQVPGVGEVPILGGLFRNTKQVMQKRELVILIKPTIVEGDAWEEDILSSQQRINGMTPRSRIEKKE